MSEEANVVQHRAMRDLITRHNDDPVVLGEVLSELGLPSMQVKATDLVGQTFNIVSAAEFDSQFEGQGRVYYCVVKMDKDDNLYSVVFGGMAVIHVLSMYIDAGRGRPLRVTLNFVDQGRHDGYYTLS